MNGQDCVAIRDRLPEYVAGLMDAEESASVEAHVQGCFECRAEETLVRTLMEARPEAPAGLASRIRSRVREEMSVAERASADRGRVVPIFRRRPRAPSWVLSAAALVVLSLGIGVIWEGKVDEMDLDPVEVALDEPLPEEWLWDDGMVAGAPVYDGLSDEDLEALIQELEG